MQTVVQEINQEYDDRLEQEKNSVSYDVLEMSGSRAVWKDVLAVYSVKVNTNGDNPKEVCGLGLFLCYHFLCSFFCRKICPHKFSAHSRIIFL